MTKEWLFNITEIDPNSMLYDPNQEAVTMFVTISEDDANVYNESIAEDEDQEEIYPDDIGGHIPDVENVVVNIGGEGAELLECVFLIPKNNRTVEQIIKEVQYFGWTLDTSFSGIYNDIEKAVYGKLK